MLGRNNQARKKIAEAVKYLILMECELLGVRLDEEDHYTTERRSDPNNIFSGENPSFKANPKLKEILTNAGRDDAHYVVAKLLGGLGKFSDNCEPWGTRSYSQMIDIMSDVATAVRKLVDEIEGKLGYEVNRDGHDVLGQMIMYLTIILLVVSGEKSLVDAPHVVLHRRQLLSRGALRICGVGCGDADVCTPTEYDRTLYLFIFSLVRYLTYQQWIMWALDLHFIAALPLHHHLPVDVRTSPPTSSPSSFSHLPYHHYFYLIFA